MGLQCSAAAAAPCSSSFVLVDRHVVSLGCSGEVNEPPCTPRHLFVVCGAISLVLDTWAYSLGQARSKGGGLCLAGALELASRHATQGSAPTACARLVQASGQTTRSRGVWMYSHVTAIGSPPWCLESSCCGDVGAAACRHGVDGPVSRRQLTRCPT